MSQIKTVSITDAVRLRCFTDPHFKTMKISVDMLIPMSALKAAQYGILPSLVSHATREYPDYASLSGRLSELYGASLDSSVRKLGEYQVLTLSAAGISSRYALEGEDMFQELCGLLFSVLFDPLRDKDGLFPQEGFEQEKRQLLELKDAEFNDKIVYAHQRCEEILFEGQPAGVNRHGSREEIASLNREELSGAWQELLQNSRFEVFVLGDCEPNPELFREHFSSLGKPFQIDYLPFEAPSAVKRAAEEMPLAQSKLSMAFRADFRPEERLLFQLMSAVFGGTPSSKLFQNVREKQSLCYYCSASLDSGSRTLYVESGVETENLRRTEEEIMRQWELLCSGELTEDELEAAKLALCNSMRSVGDSLQAVENWCVSRVFEESLETPEEAAERLMQYSREEVVAAAKRLVPAAVFSLVGKGQQ